MLVKTMQLYALGHLYFFLLFVFILPNQLLLTLKDPNTKVKEFMESKPLLSDFDAQIKYYQRLETQIEELPGRYHIGPVEYLTERIKEALVTETKAWKQAFGKALAEKVTATVLEYDKNAITKKK